MKSIARYCGFRKMPPIKAIFIDLNGTLHVENEPTPGAVEALKKLRKEDVFIKFVTNTSKESRRSLYQNLTDMGFDLELEEIHSPLKAVNEYVKQNQLNPFYLISENAKQDLPPYCNDDNMVEFDSVVIGLAPNTYTYDTLNKAFNILRSNRQHKLIALNESKYIRRSEGLVLGPGFYVKGLEYSADVEAIVMGKPSEQFFKSAIPLTVKPEECIMIGDDVKDDVKGSMLLGMRAIQVKTGKYLPDVVAEPPPTIILDNFSDAVDWIIKCRAAKE